ncbi:hypothetical protein NOS3756_31680 [Nostoc sp. NIES-3756]|uniref:Uma2 family endonuclease n=1 Tax=Nostoc sp. NIES-3756 TaxID=1751286 RepID=UPI000720263C|nr:Uma2 family endonuclease [Nostoc sp. NIES-3756]BAT54202.1 hypothetical protein NOS3756_31680 [Nostoc sp. NIES-3756]
MTAYTINLNPIIKLTDEQFYQLCQENPEVKFERNSQGELIIMSPSDNLEDAQAKMREYIDNQVKLGWLINRKTRQVEIYRQGKPTQVLDSPTQLSGEDTLPGFILNLQIIW